MEPDDSSGNILNDEIKSWESFSEVLKSNDRELFFHMLNECKVYESGAAAKGSILSTESLLMSIIFNQQKMSCLTCIQRIIWRNLSSAKGRNTYFILYMNGKHRRKNTT